MKTSLRRGFASIAALAAVLLFSAAAPASAQIVQGGACVTVTAAAVSARFSGMSVAASASSRGFYVQALQVGANTIGLRITSAAVLDADLAVIAPAMVFGASALTSVVREGTAPAGSVEGDFIPAAANFFNTAAIYVPAGKILTLLHTTANTAATSSVCFTEVP